MADWVIEAGPLGLFAAAFLAATILPFSSEAALVMALATGMPAAEALTAASLGNCLACALNYGLGRFFRERTADRLAQSRSGRRALAWMDRFGPASLLLSWAPVVGDPLTLVAGAARVSPIVFALVVFPLRVGRYLLIAHMM